MEKIGGYSSLFDTGAILLQRFPDDEELRKKVETCLNSLRKLGYYGSR